MKLVINESIFYDYHSGKEDAVQTVIAEKTGRGAVLELIECFRCSLYDCVRVALEEGDTIKSVSLCFLKQISKEGFTDCYSFVKHGKLYLKKIGKGGNGGGKENVFPTNNRK